MGIDRDGLGFETSGFDAASGSARPVIKETWWGQGTATELVAGLVGNDHGEHHDMAGIINTFEMYDLTPVSSRLAAAR